MRSIQNIAGGWVHLEVYSFASPVWQREAQIDLTTHTWGGTHEGKSRCYVSGDTRVVLSCPGWVLITNEAITRVSDSWRLDDRPLKCQHLSPMAVAQQKIVFRYDQLDYFNMGNYPGFCRWVQYNQKSSYKRVVGASERRRCDDRWVGQKNVIARKGP